MRVHSLPVRKQALLLPFLLLGIVPGFLIGYAIEPGIGPWLCAIYGLGIADMTVRWFVARRRVRVLEEQH